jgi:hypothetical protein
VAPSYFKPLELYQISPVASSWIEGNASQLEDRREILKFSARYLAELRVRAPGGRGNNQQCIMKMMNKNKNRKKPKPTGE